MSQGELVRVATTEVLKPRTGEESLLILQERFNSNYNFASPSP